MTIPQPPPMVDAKLVWRGGAGTTTWDAGVTPSWQNNGANSTFAAGDSVRFDIAADNSTSVSLTGILQPSAVTVYSPKHQTFDGTAGSLAGPMTLMKAGSSTLTLTGSHSFSGRTTVWDGAFVMNGNLPQSPLTVWGGTWGGPATAGLTGGRVAGTGTFSQPVTLSYRGGVTPGAGMGTAGTLNFAGGVTAQDGSYFALDLSNDPSGIVTPSDKVAITGNLSLAGKVGLVISPLNGTLPPGSYTLITYTGILTGNVSNFTVSVPAGTPYTLAAAGGAVTLTVPVTRAPGAIVWRGSGGTWDLATSQNWLKAGSPDVFVSGDTVTYDDSGSASPTAITGGGVLAIDSLGDAGTPGSIGAATAAASNFVINGGTLRLTGLQTNTNRNLTLGSAGGTLDVVSGSSSMQISGSGRLTKAGAGTVSDRTNVTGNLTLAGTLNVTALPGFAPGTYTLITYTGTLTDEEGLQPGTLPAGFEGTINTSTPGQVQLVVTPVLTVFEEWQIANFGSTTAPAAAATADPDGDGTPDEIEFRLGLDPKNGSSAFKASGTSSPGGFVLAWPSAANLIFEIRRSTTLSGPWQLLETMAPITAGPASYSDVNPPQPRAFYRIVLLP